MSRGRLRARAAAAVTAAMSATRSSCCGRIRSGWVRIDARGGQRRRAGMSSQFAARCQPAPSAIGKIRRPALLSAFGHVFVRELRADDGADRDCRRLDRMHSAPHARQRQCDHGDQAGPLPVSLTLCCCLPASARTGRACKSGRCGNRGAVGRRSSA